MVKQKPKVVIGRAEKVHFPTLNGLVLHARIDTGARTSSIWVLNAEENDKGLEVTFPNEEGNPAVTTPFKHYTQKKLSISRGQKQIRYRITIPATIKNRRIQATFTLADRSTQVYPVLIGRRTLTRKFIVDVSLGSILHEEEEARSAELQELIEEKVV